MKFSDNVDNGTRNRAIYFGSDPDNNLEQGIFKGYYSIVRWGPFLVHICVYTSIKNVKLLGKNMTFPVPYNITQL